jgi:subtilisin family serine protease
MTELREQVERIIDEGRGRRRTVIVQMKTEERADARLLQVAAEVHRRRNQTISARDLLPASRDELEAVRQASGKRLTAPARRALQRTEASLAVQVGAAPSPPGVEAMRAVGLSALRPLLEHPMVQDSERAAAGRESTTASRSAASVQKALWASRSAVLEMTNDDLARLPDEVPGIQGVYPNRVHRVPRLVEVRDLPAPVLDHKASSWGISKIGALSAWGAYGARGSGSRIAVLDTGVDADHPDLAGKVTAWAEFDEDGRQVPGSTPHDTDRHGTHCAGTIAGGNASGEWIGVAPEAELAVGLVLAGGSGTDAQVLAGMEWAIEQGVDAISMSLGGLTFDVEAPDPYSETLLRALLAGIPVVTAIGNEGNQTTGAPGNDWLAFAVGATDYLDRPAGFSGGRTHVLRTSPYLDPGDLPLVYSKPEVSAPGVAVTSSVPGGGWAAFNGTSMATPHVAGAIALLLSATTIRAATETAQRAFLIEDLLTGSVEELGEAGQDHRYGFGRIEVLRAIGSAKERGF